MLELNSDLNETDKFALVEVAFRTRLELDSNDNSSKLNAIISDIRKVAIPSFCFKSTAKIQ